MKNVFKKTWFPAIIIGIITVLFISNFAHAAIDSNYWIQNAPNSLATNTPGGLATGDIHVAHCYIGLGTGSPCASGGGGSPSIGGTITSGTAGSVLFVNPTATIAQNNNNFYFNNSAIGLGTNTNVALSINTGGDFTGTDAINAYGQYDAYLPNSAITNSLTGLNTDGAVPAYTVSSSRGTGTSPAQLQAGDLTGGFFGFGSQGASSPTYQNIGGMAVITTGASTNNLGGELDFYTKADGGSLTKQLSISNAGVAAFTGAVTGTTFNGVALTTGGSSTAFLNGSGTYTTPGMGVTSVATDSTLTGGPITTTGTLGINLANANTWTAEQQIQLTTTQLSLNYDGTHTTTFTTGSTGNLTIAATGAAVNIQAINASGFITATAGLGTANSGTTTFLAVSPAGITGSLNSAGLQFGGSTTIRTHALFNNVTSSSLATGDSYSNVIVGSSPITTFTSGTHALLANLVVNPLGTVTNAGATVTQTASLFVNGAGSGGTTNLNTLLQGTTEQLRLGYDLADYASFVVNSGGTLTITSTSGLTTIAGEVSTPFVVTTNSSSNFYNPISASIVHATTASLQFAGSTGAGGRAAFNGTTSTTLTVGDNYSNVLVASSPVTTPATGTNAWLANTVINAIGTVTSGGAAITNTASLYIGGASAAGTNNYALYVASGTSFFTAGINSTAGSFTTTSGNIYGLNVASTSTLGSDASLSRGNFSVFASNTAVSNTTTKYLFGGASTTFMRTGIGGDTSSTLTTGVSYANLTIGSSPITTFTSGTHAWLANLVVNPMGTITSGGATVTNTATMYVGAGITGGTNNYSLYTSGIAANVTTVTGTTYTATPSNFTILCNAASNNINITVPVSAGAIYNIKKTDSTANTCTITPASGTIDGASTKVISTQYTNVQIQADGTNLDIL